MGYPRKGFCPEKSSHQICLIRQNATQFIQNQSCYYCNLPFDQIYFNSRLLQPHYYHCDKCQLLLCFNCARKANIDNIDNAKTYSRYWDERRDPNWNDALLVGEYFRSTSPLHINRLKLNKIFENGDDYLLNKYLKTIITSFGGMKELLLFITQHATFTQLDEIYQLIANQHTKYINHDKKPLFDEDYFNKIPTECCQHMIGYLEKKMTSRKIAIQCLKESRK